MSYVVNTPADQKAMCEQIGVASVEELFRAVPDSVRLSRPLDVPAALSELSLERHVATLARSNQSSDNTVCFLGGGSYDHFIPAVVDAVAGRSEFYTAYTPYQAEASQGSLQAFFEFQTLIAQLTGMDVANASLYEGGSAVTEAVIMALNVNPKRSKVLIADSVHPEYRGVLKTYLANVDAQLISLKTPDGFLDPDVLSKQIDDDTVCVVVQHPNFFGCLEEVAAISNACQAKGALFIVSFDPISLGVLKRPGDYAADIAVAEGQSLGNPMSYGGPYLGLMACRDEYRRKVPGRLVGQTVDRNGKRCWVLTLQMREQHIRREKATSNICTNQGLMALKATVYLAALGPEGLRETAALCTRKAHYLASELAELEGIGLPFDRPFFKEFVIRVQTDADGLLRKLLAQGFHAGLHLGRWYPEFENCISIAVTEKRTKDEMDALVRMVSA